MVYAVRVLLFGLLALGACSPQGPPWSRWGETLQMPPGVRAEDLPDPSSEGARLVATYCSQCHEIPSPAMHSASDWEPILRRMVFRMERSARMGGMMGACGGSPMPRGMHGAAVPSGSEQRTILAYLQSHSLLSIPDEEFEEETEPGAVAFKRACVRCHALPDPGQHTAAEWPDVVQRMRKHMRELEVSDLSSAEEEEIVRYLVRHARPASD